MHRLAILLLAAAAHQATTAHATPRQPPPPHDGSASASANSTYDVVVWACSPAGFAAALGAKAAGAQSVLVLEPTNHVGGMAAAGGIGLRDCEQDEIRDNNSTQHTWGMRNAQYYGVKAPVWQPDNWLGEQTFKAMLAEADVTLRMLGAEDQNDELVEGPDGVVVSEDGGERRIMALKLRRRDGSIDVISAAYFIDASYEGDLLVAAGVTYTYGRESSTQYGEGSFGGVTNGSIAQFKTPISPFVKDGMPEILPFVQAGVDPRKNVGAADKNLMAYSFRACLTTNASNSVPITAPAGYDPADFELARRYLRAELAANKTPSTPWGDLAYHGYEQLPKAMKFDACCGGAAVGIDVTGLASEAGNGIANYAIATRKQRAAIAARHRYWVQGLIYFWTHDPAVPADLRAKHAAQGLCKDEWPDNGHFPTQLYVREAARMVGDKVFTYPMRQAQHAAGPGKPGGCLDDAVAIQSWGVDIHEMQRVAVVDNPAIVFNEGLTSPGLGGNYLSEIPYWVVLPKRKELANLAAPNCPSVSHVAFAGIREEPTLWQLGQAAGTAAAVAGKRAGQALHDVDVAELQGELLAQHTFVHWPPRAKCTDPLPPPPAPPAPVHEKCAASAVSAITVAGAGTKSVNGVYKKTSASANGFPIFRLDASHELYRYSGVWRLGEQGHGLSYVSTGVSGADGPPCSGWAESTKGMEPAPTISC